ncbi:phosphodiesterase [Diaminobutyricimonas sp. LJ205]|uniref:phosphodiesterase n=1 Tax=Diaminobutyricimonas sp. LJ205 TaxID=2683590 RepID=UPI0012F4F169|nr:phosphodiesterase [Diaminobutyricimonas sp. LJ205]
MIQLGQYPAPVHTLVHLSDTHFLGGSRPLYGAVNVERNLERALAHLERSGIRPEALLFTGDLADLAEPDAYGRLREVVEPVAERIGAQVIWVMGNHDERAAFASLLHGEPETDAPQDRVYRLGGLRVISLDSTVPGYHHGELSDGQLQWLRDELATPAPEGTILALHHPPIPVAVEIMAALELEGQDRLAAVVEGSDIRAILGGHLHHASHSLFAGIPVSVAAATCYTLDAAASADRLLSGVDGGQSFTLVHVYADRVVHTIVPVGEYAEIAGWPAAARAAVEALDPAERREQLSSKRSTFSMADAARADAAQAGAPAAPIPE